MEQGPLAALVRHTGDKVDVWDADIPQPSLIPKGEGSCSHTVPWLPHQVTHGSPEYMPFPQGRRDRAAESPGLLALSGQAGQDDVY